MIRVVVLQVMMTIMRILVLEMNLNEVEKEKVAVELVVSPMILLIEISIKHIKTCLLTTIGCRQIHIMIKMAIHI